MLDVDCRRSPTGEVSRCTVISLAVDERRIGTARSGVMAQNVGSTMMQVGGLLAVRQTDITGTAGCRTVGQMC